MGFFTNLLEPHCSREPKGESSKIPDLTIILPVATCLAREGTL